VAWSGLAEGKGEKGKRGKGARSISHETCGARLCAPRLESFVNWRLEKPPHVTMLLQISRNATFAPFASFA